MIVHPFIIFFQIIIENINYLVLQMNLILTLIFDQSKVRFTGSGRRWEGPSYLNSGHERWHLGRSRSTSRARSSWSRSSPSPLGCEIAQDLQDRPHVPKHRRGDATRSHGGLPGGVVRGHQPVSHSRQEGLHLRGGLEARGLSSVSSFGFFKLFFL